MKILFYDTIVSGHHTEYIAHLIKYLSQEDSKYDEVIFILNKDFFKIRDELRFALNSRSKLTFAFITEEEYKKTTTGNIFQRSWNSHKTLDKYAKIFNVDSVYLLYFNIFQFPLIFFRPRYSVSGILFMQFSRLDRKSLKNQILYYRKLLMTWFLAQNGRLGTIHLLNDSKGAESMNKMFNTNVFRMLSDPINQNVSLLDYFDVCKELSLPKNKNLLLHCGGLGERKGTLEVIRSVPFFNKDEFYLVLAGNPENKRIEKKIDVELELARRQGAEIYYLKGFIEDSVLNSLFRMAKVVLIPYKKAEGSSGVLGHAANFNVPVLATDKGLVGDLVKSYALGLTITHINQRSIAEGVKKIVDFGNRPSRSKEFVLERTPDIFCKGVIESC